MTPILNGKFSNEGANFNKPNKPIMLFFSNEWEKLTALQYAMMMVKDGILLTHIQVITQELRFPPGIQQLCTTYSSEFMFFLKASHFGYVLTAQFLVNTTTA